MRQHAKYFYVLFFIIIITFVFWGVGTNDKDQPRFVAEIGSERVTATEFWTAHRNAMDSYREIYKGKSYDEIEQQTNLKQRVLDSLIDEKAMLLTAQDLGIAVSDEELQKAIVKDPNFVRDGSFRVDIYRRALANNRLTPEAYEAMLRKKFMMNRLMTMVIAGVDVTDADTVGIKADQAGEGMVRQMALLGKRNAAVKSFIDAARARYKVTKNMDAIS
jgi:peptidyl-prolyl cis-trans isomerase D